MKRRLETGDSERRNNVVSTDDDDDDDDWLVNEAANES